MTDICALCTSLSDSGRLYGIERDRLTKGVKTRSPKILCIIEKRCQTEAGKNYRENLVNYFQTCTRLTLKRLSTYSFKLQRWFGYGQLYTSLRRVLYRNDARDLSSITNNKVSINYVMFMSNARGWHEHWWDAWDRSYGRENSELIMTVGTLNRGATDKI